MKVKELISILKELNQDLMVVVDGHVGGIDEVAYVDGVHLKLNVNKSRIYGPHEQVSTKEESDCCAVRIV